MEMQPEPKIRYILYQKKEHLIRYIILCINICFQGGNATRTQDKDGNATRTQDTVYTLPEERTFNTDLKEFYIFFNNLNIFDGVKFNPAHIFEKIFNWERLIGHHKTIEDVIENTTESIAMIGLRTMLLTIIKPINALTKFSKQKSIELLLNKFFKLKEHPAAELSLTLIKLTHLVTSTILKSEFMVGRANAENFQNLLIDVVIFIINEVVNIFDRLINSAIIAFTPIIKIKPPMIGCNASSTANMLLKSFHAFLKDFLYGLSDLSDIPSDPLEKIAEQFKNLGPIALDMGSIAKYLLQLIKSWSDKMSETIFLQEEASWKNVPHFAVKVLQSTSIDSLNATRRILEEVLLVVSRARGHPIKIKHDTSIIKGVRAGSAINLIYKGFDSIKNDTMLEIFRKIALFTINFIKDLTKQETLLTFYKLIPLPTKLKISISEISERYYTFADRLYVTHFKHKTPSIENDIIFLRDLINTIIKHSEKQIKNVASTNLVPQIWGVFLKFAMSRTLLKGLQLELNSLVQSIIFFTKPIVASTAKDTIYDTSLPFKDKLASAIYEAINLIHKHFKLLEKDDFLVKEPNILLVIRFLNKLHAIGISLFYSCVLGIARYILRFLSLPYISSTTPSILA